MMTADELQKIIGPLETEHYTLYQTLTELLEPNDLRAALLKAIEPLEVGSYNALAIHRTLQALTRAHPINTVCPNTQEEIDFNDVAAYLALSSGYVVKCTPEYKQALSQNHALWFCPPTRVVYSPHDVNYIETVFNIKKPAAPAEGETADFDALVQMLAALHLMNMLNQNPRGVAPDLNFLLFLAMNDPNNNNNNNRLTLIATPIISRGTPSTAIVDETSIIIVGRGHEEERETFDVDQEGTRRGFFACFGPRRQPRPDDDQVRANRQRCSIM